MSRIASDTPPTLVYVVEAIRASANTLFRFSREAQTVPLDAATRYVNKMRFLNANIINTVIVLASSSVLHVPIKILIQV